MADLKTRVETLMLPFVRKPMRYAGGELNCIRKDLSKVRLRGVLCFPDLYDIGMSHSGLQMLYHIVNRSPGWALSRSFQPWTDAEKIMREQKIPLYDLEYFLPLHKADWIGFSVQYELQYANIVNMMDLGGIAPFRADRGDGDPLVIAGGPCMGNPEPLAHFVDCFVAGDGEQAIVAICKVLETAKAQELPRSEVLEKLSRIQGTYVPSLYQETSKGRFIIPDVPAIINAAKVKSLSDDSYPDRPLVPLMDVVHHRLAVEVMRGCSRGCRFCSAGTYYRPVRERSHRSVYDQICSGINSTGWRDIGLLSLSTADYTPFSPLLSSIQSLKDSHHVSISLPSTRIDALTPGQMDLLDAISPSSSITIAPEAGSARLRRVINKDFTDETILSTVQQLMSRNVQTLKLYFMIGLPTETQEDIDGIISLVSTIASLVRSSSRRKVVNVSVSPFSPKSQTPFQREAMEKPAVLLEKGRFIKQSLKRCSNVKVSYRDPLVTLLETLMARGDRTVGKLIHEAWTRGARLDGWDEHFDAERWMAAARELGIDIEKYLLSIPDEQELPWEFISTGVTQSFLEQERRKAMAGETTEDCRTGACAVCGACDGQLSGIMREYAGQKPSNGLKTQAVESAIVPNTYRYRFAYIKGEMLRFLGHLDMVSIFHRAFLSSGMPLVYSRGYHPHPRISFGPPLPFGVTGLNEFFDAEMRQEIHGDPLIVNKWLPEDLRISSVIPVNGKLPSLNASVNAARYLFTPVDPLSVDYMQKRADAILGSSSVTVQISKGAENEEKELRHLIKSLKVIQHNGSPAWEALISLVSGGTCKPSELLSVLCPELPAAGFRILRIECIFSLSR